jgi:hypothetical protein
MAQLRPVVPTLAPGHLLRHGLLAAANLSVEARSLDWASCSPSFRSNASSPSRAAGRGTSSNRASRPPSSTATVCSGFVEVCGDRVVILSDPDEEEKAEEEKGGTS